MQRNPHLYIAASDIEGRGVFCTQPISKGEIIEICPVIIVPPREMKLIDSGILYNYYFVWEQPALTYAIALGYGSLYNHSYEPNVEYLPDYANETLDFFAIKDIKIGEEILINYNGTPEDKSLVWFLEEEE